MATAPISGNQNFTVVSNHAAELTVGTLETSQVKALILGDGNGEGQESIHYTSIFLYNI